MTAQTQPNMNPASAEKRTLQGASIGAGLVATFLLFLLVATGNMDLGLWILPAIGIAGVGGAIGGAFFYVMHRFVPLEGWKKNVANFIFGLVFLGGLWMCMILGLAIVGLWD